MKRLLLLLLLVGCSSDPRLNDPGDLTGQIPDHPSIRLCNLLAQDERALYELTLTYPVFDLYDSIKATTAFNRKAAATEVCQNRWLYDEHHGLHDNDIIR